MPKSDTNTIGGAVGGWRSPPRKEDDGPSYQHYHIDTSRTCVTVGFRGIAAIRPVLGDAIDPEMP
jgi:hypothetical protein